jgi:alpha-L-fucosidase
LRFTTTTDTFCIIALELPETLIIDHDGEIVPYAMLTVHRPVPVLQHDKVFLLGGSGEALNVQWREGKLVIIVPIDELNLVKHAWAFQVQYA